MARGLGGGLTPARIQARCPWPGRIDGRQARRSPRRGDELGKRRRWTPSCTVDSLPLAPSPVLAPLRWDGTHAMVVLGAQAVGTWGTAPTQSMPTVWELVFLDFWHGVSCACLALGR